MKIIKKSKKIIYNFLITLFVIIFSLSSVAGVLSMDPIKNTFAAPTLGASQAVVKIESDLGSPYARAGKDGVINFRISATNISGDVIVYYRTVNGSAIEKENYDAIPTLYGGLEDSGRIDLNGRCTLNIGQKYKDFSIQTRSVKYSSYYNGSSTTNPNFIDPCFYIEIYAVSSNATVQSDRYNLTCYVNSEHNYKVVYNDYLNSGYVFYEYKNADVSSERTSPVFDNTITDGKYPDWYMVCSLGDSNKQKTWEKDFISTDIASGFFSTDFYCFEYYLVGGNSDIFVRYYADYNGPQTNTSYQKDYSMSNWYDCKNQFAMVEHDGEGVGFDEYRTLVGLSFDQALAILKNIFPDANSGDLSSKLINQMKDYGIKNAKIKKSGGDSVSNFFLYSPWFYGISADNTLLMPYAELLKRGMSKNKYYDLGLTSNKGDLEDFWDEVDDYYDDGDDDDISDAIDEFVNLFDDGLALSNSSFRQYSHDSNYKLPEYCSKVFFQIPKGDLNICVNFHMDGWKERDLDQIINTYVLEDITAPTVVSVTGTDRNFDETVNIDSGTRVSVRFSEPVFVKDASSVKLNANLVLVGNDPKPVQLSYVGGSGTDTLYFDFNKEDYLAAGDNAKELILTEISGANNVCDFAMNPHHPTSSLGSNKKVSCIYDYRTPIIKDITGDGTVASAYPQKVQVMKINTKDISDTGFIYYAWSDKDIEPSQAKNQLTFNKIRVTGDHTQVKLQEGNGRYYLYAYAESALKIKSNGVAKGSTVLDNIEPEAISISDNSDSTTRHTFKLTMDGFGEGERAELGKIYLLYSPTAWYASSEAGSTPFKGQSTLVYDIDNYELNKLFGTNEYDDNKSKDDFNPNEIKINVSYANVGLTRAGWSFIGFYVVDAAGNESEYLPYGKRVIFTTAETFNMEAITKSNIDNEPNLNNIDDLYVYNSSIGEIKFRLPTKINGYDIEKGDGNKLKLTMKITRVIDDVNTEEYQGTISGQQEVTLTTDDEGNPLLNDEGKPMSLQRYVITVPLKDASGTPFMDGCYKFSFVAQFYDISASKRSEATSPEFTIFLYNPSTDKNIRQTVNYNNMNKKNGYVTKIYTLSEEATYCYINSTNNPSNCSNSNSVSVSYSGEKPARLIFSSREAAREYLIYKEYQDVAALKITPTIVQRFQEGTTYKVASEDQSRATDPAGNFKLTPGDFWLRYKRSNWQQGSTSDWVYYYYGPSNGLETIDAAKLTGGEDCHGIQTAIEAVVDRILNTYGSYTYVHTSYYNDDTIDEYYTPRFDDSQIHSERETTTQTIDGTNLTGFLLFSGDGSIYSMGEVADSNYTYVPSYSYTFKTYDFTRIFYRIIDDSTNSVYELLPTEGKYNLKDLPHSQEKYMIYECTEKGFFSYPVFVDRAAPKVKVRYTGKTGWVEPKEPWDKEYADGLAIYTKSFQVLSLEDMDEDLSYVAVFRKGGMVPTHVMTYTAAELRNGANLALNEDGTYIVEILDRSGNMYTILVRIRTDEINANITEAENRYVKFAVSNREESEVELFEVRLKPLDGEGVEGRLIRSAFNDTSFNFTESGHYTFYILDRYNNECTMEYDFERKIPDVSIRYKLNEVDSYTAYNSKDADQPLILSGTEDEVTIYTRAQLAFVFNSEMNYNVRFLTGAVEGIDYTITSNGLNTTLAILTSSEFYSFEISYNEYNYIKKVYNVYVDRDAPQVKLAYESNEYEYDDIEYFKSILQDVKNKADEDKNFVYEQDENVYLQAPSVNYQIVKTEKSEVLYNSIVSTPYLDLTLPDKSGLKYFKITRDGNIVAEVDGSSTKIYKDGVLYKVTSGNVVKYYENGKIRFEISSDTVKVYQSDRLIHQYTYTISGSEITLYEKSVPVRTIIREVNGHIENYYEGEELVYTLNTIDDNPYKIIEEGKYDIYVEDVVGNKSNFVFTKVEYEIYRIEVDGSSDKPYGNGSMLITVLDNCEIAYIAEVDGIRYYYCFRYEDQQVKGIEYRITYQELLDDSGEPIKDLDGNIIYEYVLEEIGGVSTVGDPEYVEPILDGTLSTFLHDHWYLDKETNVNIMITSTGELKIRIDVNGEHEFYIQTRVTGFKVNQPIIYEAVLSQKKSNVVLKDIFDEKIETNSNNESIYINRAFKIADVENDIVSVKVYQSLTPSTFTDGRQVYKRGSAIAGGYYSEKGYYKIEIENIYGNVNTYFIVISDSFNVNVASHYADLTDNLYNFENDLEVFRSNSSVEIEADSALIKTAGKVEITKKNSMDEFVAYEGAIITYTERSLKVVISEEGEYRVIICDEYGNVWDKKVEILKSELIIDEDVLTGWNEKALKYSEGYTNTKLSIDINLLPVTVKYVALTCGEQTKIIYDDISQKSVPFNAQAFNEILGDMGNGKYNVIFRDAYGNSFVREVHYSDTSTLVAQRKTKTNQEGEIYSDELLTNGTGLWTNSAFILTGSISGILTVNGEAVSSPYEKSATQEALKSYIEYEITYIDEYGFEYAFTAYISREDVEIVMDESVNVLELDDVLYTNDDIKFTFKNNVKCKYYLNGNGPYNYNSGEAIIKDGSYRFVLEDLAGNATTYSIVRDTVCDYAFIETNTERQIVNGDVINNNARFKNLNNDQNFIKLAVLNGVKQDNEDLSISKDGKWEILVSDDLGNLSYFSFILVSHETNKFSYVTPYGYTVNSISRFYKDATEDLTKHEEVKQVKEDEKVIGNKFAFAENGVYYVVMSNDVGETISFNFTIELALPKAELTNVEDGGITRRDVSFTNLKVGDIVDIYKDGKLVKTQEYTVGDSAPVISEAGSYKVVVTNVAGNQVEFNFVRKHVVNTAGSILIIVVNLALAVALLVGTVYRTKNKTDK